MALFFRIRETCGHSLEESHLQAMVNAVCTKWDTAAFHQYEDADFAFAYFNHSSVKLTEFASIQLYDLWVIGELKLFNRAPLQNKLGTAEALSDIALVAHAFLRWGTRCFEHLQGIFHDLES